jgi:hypothetical protein
MIEKFWWCAGCNKELDGSKVTSEGYHEGCGGRIWPCEDMTALELIKKEEETIAELKAKHHAWYEARLLLITAVDAADDAQPEPDAPEFRRVLLHREWIKAARKIIEPLEGK